MVCGHWFFSYFPILSRMYSLVAIFFLIPIFFSHSFARMGWIIDNGIWHFESVKMSLFIVLIIVALFEMSFTHRDKLSHLLQQKHIPVSYTHLDVYKRQEYTHRYGNGRFITIWKTATFFVMWKYKRILNSMRILEKREKPYLGIYFF